MISLIYAGLFKTPPVRKFFKIPPIVKYDVEEDANPLRQLLNNKKGAFLIFDTYVEF